VLYIRFLVIVHLEFAPDEIKCFNNKVVRELQVATEGAPVDVLRVLHIHKVGDAIKYRLLSPDD
jgi:hypothetical protein